MGVGKRSNLYCIVMLYKFVLMGFFYFNFYFKGVRGLFVYVERLIIFLKIVKLLCSIVNS